MTIIEKSSIQILKISYSVLKLFLFLEKYLTSLVSHNHMNKKSMGAHILLNLYGLDKKLLEKEPIVMELLDEVVDKAKLTKFGEISHQFEPVGVTGIILLGESHMSVHTWPEFNSAAIDIFSCVGKEEAERASKVVLELFKPKKFDKKVIIR